MKEFKPIMVKEAKRLAEEYNKNIILIVGWDSTSGKINITTYGESREEKDWAVQAADIIFGALDPSYVPAELEAHEDLR